MRAAFHAYLPELNSNCPLQAGDHLKLITTTADSCRFAAGISPSKN
jgi:hypothetical protein